MADSYIHEKLYYASGNGNDTFVRELLAAGADPNKYKDIDGITALIKAASNCRDSTVSILIQHGADLNVQTNYGSTALTIAAWKGRNEVTTTLIKAGADLNIQTTNGKTALTIACEKGNNKMALSLIEAGADLGTELNKRDEHGNTILHSAALEGYNIAVTTLIKAGADLKIQNNAGETALAVAASGEVASTLMEAGAEVPPSLACRMMNTNPSFISSILDFLSKKLAKFEDKDDKEDYQKTKEILGIEIMKREQKVMFYNVECKRLDDKSLLKYIDSQNVRLSRQREELIDLSVKIANLNNRDDSGKAMEEVINHYKSGLPSGVGLRDMLTMIKERYPWSSSKKMIMIFVSLVTCLLGIGLFVFDLTTDVEFSKMFNRNKTLEYDEESFNKTFSTFLSKNGLTFPSCWTEMKEEFDGRKNSTSVNINHNDYVVTGWIALWHCIQPFVATLIVSLSMKCCKGGKCSVPEELERLKEVEWWLLNCCCCCIPNLVYFGPYVLFLLFKGLFVVITQVPLPAFTHLYRFYLDVRCHHARSQPDFRAEIVEIEEEIREHEALGKL